MNKISCNVIQDLLPLYVDNMLSQDSIQLMETHLKDCWECSRQLEELKQENFHEINSNNVTDMNAQHAFKRIKRKLRIKRIVSVGAAIALTLGAVRAGYYFYAEKGTYIPLEESGLYMKGDQLYASKSYLGKYRTYLSADQHSMFIIMIDTVQANREYPELVMDTLVYDFADQLDPADMEPNIEYGQLSGIEAVYYLSEEYTNFRFDTDNKAVWAQQSEEAVSNSALLWESVK